MDLTDAAPLVAVLFVGVAAPLALFGIVSITELGAALIIAVAILLIHQGVRLRY